MLRQSSGATRRQFANGVLDFGVMGNTCLRFCVLSLAFVALSCAAQQSQTPLRGRLSLPTKDWGVVLALPGFVAKNVETKPDGRRYMVAENENTKVVVSVTLEETKPGTPSSCRHSLEEKTKHPPLKIQDVRFSRSGDVDVMRYVVAEFKGQRINQESLFACQFYDNTYIDLHVSKVNYVTADEPLFADVLTSMHIDKVQRSSMELVGQASRLYLQHDYRGAIAPYSQALEFEKVNPTLEKSLWYVLVDNLGMSYGITGNLLGLHLRRDGRCHGSKRLSEESIRSQSQRSAGRKHARSSQGRFLPEADEEQRISRIGGNARKVAIRNFAEARLK